MQGGQWGYIWELLGVAIVTEQVHCKTAVCEGGPIAPLALL